jgi:AcrR family transcriptional regulator
VLFISTVSADGSKTSKGEATRDAIVRMALTQAMEVGLEGISLGVLASALGLSKSGLFAHFKSKEALQLAVLEESIELFAEKVVIPALAKPRGEPRVRALFENKLAWIETNGLGEGCIFASLIQEYDDRPGVVRDRLVQSQQQWRDTIAKAVQLAIRERHFDAEEDAEQLAFELVGIDASFHESYKLLEDPAARQRAMRAYERLLESAKPRRRR